MNRHGPHYLPAPRVRLGLPYEPLMADRQLQRMAEDQVERELGRLYPRLHEGGQRLAFDGGRVVYKIGSIDSLMTELSMYERPELADHLPVAPCRMVYHENGCPILIMETVNPVRNAEGLPDWALRVDGIQVGRNVHGEVLIFDADFGVSEASRSYNPEDVANLHEFMAAHPVPQLFAAG